MAISAGGSTHSDYHSLTSRAPTGCLTSRSKPWLLTVWGVCGLGTRNGLACYDGYSFTTYYHDPGDSTSLNHNFVIKLLVDSRNDLWVGTEKGVCRYCPETDNFRSYDVGGERVGRIVETLDSTIIIGGSNLRKFDRKTQTFRRMPRQDEGYIVGLAVSPDNRVFVSTNKSLAWYDAAIESCTFLIRRSIPIS